jgi:hypothetical protein
MDVFILQITSNTSPANPTNTRTTACRPDEDTSFPFLMSGKGIWGIQVLYELKLIVELLIRNFLNETDERLG